MGSPTPNRNRLVKWNNPYSITGYYTVCSEYGVNPEPVWLTGKWMYSYSGLFTDGVKQASENTHFSNDYSRLDYAKI